jgi:hypothetical protein
VIKDDQTFPAALLPGAQMSQPPEPSIYELMNQYLFDYRFGRITFLELLDKWKEVLNLTAEGSR